MRAGGICSTMQLVDTPADSEGAPKRRRTTNRESVAPAERSPENVTPLKQPRQTRQVRTSLGEQKPEAVITAVIAPAVAAEEAAPKRRRTRKADAATATAATTPVEAVAEAPSAPAAETEAEAAPKRRRSRKTEAVATTEATVQPVAVVAPIAPEPEAAPPPTRRRTRKSAAVAATEAVAEPVAAVEAPAPTPKRRRTRKSETTPAPETIANPIAPVDETDAVAEAETARETPKRRRIRKAAPVAAPEAATEAPRAEASEIAPAPKRRRARKADAVVEQPAALAPGEAAVTIETAAAATDTPAQAEPSTTDELGPDWTPTVTRVRILRRRGGSVITEPVADSEGRRRRRRVRRLRPTTESSGTSYDGPTPLDPAPPAPRETVIAFGGLRLTAQTARALEEMKYETPTEIQAKAIPLLLEGRDVVGQAQTGTGKTAAFGIPLVERIDPEMLVVQALVLAPTRELASQISQELGKIGRRRGVRVAAIYGGASMGAQLGALARGAQVVVGTPGRILDHLKRGTLSFESVSYLVLDEADRMLDMGFMPDVERILRRTPRNRQTALFSATVPTVVRIISRRHMRDAVTVQVKPEERTVAAIDQVFYEVAERDKPEALRRVLEEQTPERAMVFCRTQIAVDRLTRILRRDGLTVEAIHGSLGQGQREKVIADFRSGAVTLLIATNLAARGLDIPEVSHVINYDIPEESESYVHRIGRTARMGREGMAITFVAEWDEKSLSEIKKVTNGALRQERLSLYA
jgi:superfamily II DNA/RNA helicase